MPDCNLMFSCVSEVHAVGCPWEPQSPVQDMSVREWEFMIAGLSTARTTLPGAGWMVNG